MLGFTPVLEGAHPPITRTGLFIIAWNGQSSLGWSRREEEPQQCEWAQLCKKQRHKQELLAKGFYWWTIHFWSFLKGSQKEAKRKPKGSQKDLSHRKGPPQFSEPPGGFLLLLNPGRPRKRRPRRWTLSWPQPRRPAEFSTKPWIFARRAVRWK